MTKSVNNSQTDAVTKTRATFVSLMLASVAALGLSACGPAAPAHPTWAGDIHPLLIAKCIRCHNTPGGGDVLVPKNSIAAGGLAATQSFDYATVADLMAVPASLGIVKQAGAATDKNSPFIKASPTLFMPPFPAEPLADWEIQTIQNWLIESPLQ